MRNTGLTPKDTHPLNNVCLACKKDRKAFCHLPIIDGVKGSDWKWVKGFLCPPPTTINTITTIPPPPVASTSSILAGKQRAVDPALIKLDPPPIVIDQNSDILNAILEN